MPFSLFDRGWTADVLEDGVKSRAQGARGKPNSSPVYPHSTRASSEGPRLAKHILGLAALVPPHCVGTA